MIKEFHKTAPDCYFSFLSENQFTLETVRLLMSQAARVYIK